MSFNSRTRGACDLGAFAERKRQPVSIHARAGRATFTIMAWVRRDGFNSRTRGACDVAGRELVRVVLVSIHARAGRATPDARPRRRPGQVSIHARAGRATRPGGASRNCAKSFNSRTRGACDLALVDADKLLARVSIHARAGRATDDLGAEQRLVGVSIHARAGRATINGESYYNMLRFNSRTRGACDFKPRLDRRRVVGFNSRTRGACDTRRTERSDLGMFQFTHARGVRPTGAQNGENDNVSIHARAGRATAR